MRLPPGFTVRVHDDVRSLDGGRVLVGGSPLRAMRLTQRAKALIADGEIRVAGDASAVLAERLLDANLAVPALGPRDRAAPVDITVIVPVRDRISQLYRALSGLASLKVIVVDDASEDPDAVAGVAREHGAEHVRLETNVGPAAARNTGLALVSTPYVAFVDCDVQVSAATLIGLTAHFADPRVALVAPQLRGSAVNDRPRWFERYEECSPALGLGERACSVGPGAAVAWLPSACLVGRTDRLTGGGGSGGVGGIGGVGASGGIGGVGGVGGFDAAMRVGEDVDLVWRLVAAGHRVRYDPGFEARHDVRPTLRAWMGRKFAYGTGGAALAKRHPGNIVTAVLSPSMGMAALALLARRPWSVPAALAGAGRGAQVLAQTLPDVPGRRGLAARLSLRGLWWAMRQESALALRHWWPVAFGAALVSRRARRLIVSAMVVDLAACTSEFPGRNPMLIFAGRRLDDIAYGAGLWWGAMRSADVRCLRLRVAGSGRRGSSRSSRSSRSCRADGEPARVARESASAGMSSF